MPNPTLVFLLNLLATWYMVGLIWMVQVVHYPMFNRVGAQEFKQYEHDHNQLITPIVGVAMLLEIATALALLWMRPDGFPAWAGWVGVGLVAVIWLSTALIQVPCHAELMHGFQESIHQRLVASNWIRTVCWSARGVSMGYFALQIMQRNG